MSTTTTKTLTKLALVAVLGASLAGCVTQNRTQNALICGAGGAVAGAIADRILFGGTGLIGAAVGGVGAGAICAYATPSEQRAADASLRNSASSGEPVSFRLAAAENEGKESTVSSRPKGPIFIADGKTCRQFVVEIARAGDETKTEERRMCRDENSDWQVASAN